MIKAKFNDKDLFRDIMNVVEYARGYVEGAEKGKSKFLAELGVATIEIAKEFIDINARMDPQRLHHVYEWYLTGSPEARLYDIDYAINKDSVFFTYQFKQSQSVSRGSTTPFYNKAEVMESGMPVTIKTKTANVLAFDANGETFFRPGPIVVDKPGGAVAGQFEKVLDVFFNQYFRQSFLKASGIAYNLESPAEFHKNLRKNKGRAEGIKAGYNWIVGAVK
jgi:hypothetical protein